MSAILHINQAFLHRNEADILYKLLRKKVKTRMKSLFMFKKKGRTGA